MAGGQVRAARRSDQVPFPYLQETSCGFSPSLRAESDSAECRKTHSSFAASLVPSEWRFLSIRMDVARSS